MGGGLVLFGVGGATSGGLLDAFKQRLRRPERLRHVQEARRRRARAASRRGPHGPARPGPSLTRVRFQQASTGDGFDQTNGVFTDKGKQSSRPPTRRGTKYLTLDREARRHRRVADGPGLRRSTGSTSPTRPSSAMEIIIDRRKPTGPALRPARHLAYQAGQTRKAELASKKAVALAPKDDREQIKAQLDAARQAAAAQRLHRLARRRPPRPRRSRPCTSRRARALPRYPVSPRPYSSTGRAADS